MSEAHEQEGYVQQNASGSPSSPAAARGIGAGTARRLAADGLAVAVLDLKEGDCGATVDAITAAGGRALAVGADVSDAEQVKAAVGQGRRRARPARGAGQQRRRAPRQPAVQDDRRRLGHGPGRAPARRVPDEPGLPEAHGGPAVRPDRQPVVQLGAGQPRPGQLLGGQGRAAGLHQDAGHRARPVRHHRQRGRARLHRHRHDGGHRGPGRHGLRGLPEGAPPRRSRSAGSAPPTTSRT